MIMKRYTRQHLTTLQEIVTGEYFSELAITQAISNTDNMQAKILLSNMLNGLFTFQMRMELQYYINDELAKLGQ